MNEDRSPAIPHYAAGAEEFRKGNFETAAENFRKAIEADKEFYRAHAYLGMTLDRLGRIDEAIEAYRDCIEIAPDYHKAFNNVGELYRRKGLLDYAMMVFKMATEITPQHAPYWYNLGITYNDIGMREKAEKALAKACELEPENYQTATELAQVRFTLQKFDEALRTLETFLREAPDHERAPEVRARINLLKRKIEERRAGQADPEVPPARLEKPPETPPEIRALRAKEKPRAEDETRPLPPADDEP